MSNKTKADPSAEEINTWLDSIEPDPADARDATHFRRAAAAVAAGWGGPVEQART